MGSAFSIGNARVFDGTALSAPRSVHLADGLIVDVPRADSVTMDAAGAALIPGLIDAHVHVDAPGQAGTLAHWGVTTALDMAAKDLSIIAGLRGRGGAAEILTAGSPAGPAHGTHIKRMGYSASIGITKPSDAEAWVAARVAEGSDYIKVLLEPSIPLQPKPLDPKTAAAIVVAAHAVGKKVIAHTTTAKTAEIALAAGVDAITHIPLGEVLSASFAQQVAAAGVVVIPTMSMMQGIAADWPFPVKPPGVSFDKVIESVGVLHAAGVTIVAGTDANADPSTPARPPHGESLHGELELMVRAGLSPVDALRSATELAAGFAGLADRGRVASGLRADLVLVGGDPTAGIGATRDIHAVWIAGERVR